MAARLGHGAWGLAQRRQQPQCAADVEQLKSDLAVALFFLCEQCGDQKAAEHEEDVDAEKATRRVAVL